MKVKMFSLISMIMLAFSVSVSAASTVTSDGEGDASVGMPENQTHIMAVNPGDTITIQVSNAADDITLISYKGSMPVADKMQYINQYDQETTTKITYVIREIDNTQNGLYLLRINDGTNVSSFYYKVGRPVLSTESESVNYYKKVDFTGRNDEFNNTTSVAYLASFTPAGGTVERYGFTVKNNLSTAEEKDVYINGGIAGDAEYQFGITIYNLKAYEDNTIEEIINNLVVLPYVNYSDTEGVNA
ncbi:MAG: hypothetical protein IJ423_02905 [Clostridia bacterium]|nr:hypothetical protein [Clostridia bacterium]